MICQSLNNQSQKSLYILLGSLLSILTVATLTDDNFNPLFSSLYPTPREERLVPILSPHQEIFKGRACEGGKVGNKTHAKNRAIPPFDQIATE
jgi:hypothetical protein